MIPKDHGRLNDSGERLPVYSANDEELAQKAIKFAQRMRQFRCALKSPALEYAKNSTRALGIVLIKL
jgi:hypothetical protein